MPYPAHGLVFLISLLFPSVNILVSLFFDFIGFNPVSGNVLFITSTNRAALGLAYLLSDIELTLSIEVGSEGSKVFSLDE